MSNITTFEILDNEIKKFGGKPIVLEALWGGDTQGWHLLLYVYISSGFLFSKKETRHYLGEVTISEGMEYFTGNRYTVSVLAKKFGEKAIEKYNLTFYFPSEIDADEDCPSWADRHLGINCADCNKLIIPTDSPYLPKDICYNCHLRREQKDKVKQEESHDDGVTMYLVKNGEYENIGYCTFFKDFTIAPFIKKKVQYQFKPLSINIITLQKPDIEELNKNLKKALNQELKKYKKPVIHEQFRAFAQIIKKEYNGIEYELSARFDKNHEKIYQLLHSLETNQKALNENSVYEIYFKKGITYRDDTILRYINYIGKGESDIKSIITHYKTTLTESEVLTTIKKLEQMDCLTIDYETILITQTGRNIV